MNNLCIIITKSQKIICHFFAIHYVLLKFIKNAFLQIFINSILKTERVYKTYIYKKKNSFFFF